MKGLIETLKNIYKIEDLRNRIFTTLGFILIYRLGAHVVLPGIDPQELQGLQSQSADGIMGF
jgi:preprotein translocase subunit SecY